MVCDRHGHPLGAHLTPGQSHESQAVVELIEGVDWEDWQERPLAYPMKLAGDKAYRAEWIDEWLLELGVEPVIPSKSNQDRDDRTVPFDHGAYRERNPEKCNLSGWTSLSGFASRATRIGLFSPGTPRAVRRQPKSHRAMHPPKDSGFFAAKPRNTGSRSGRAGSSLAGQPWHRAASPFALSARKVGFSLTIPPRANVDLGIRIRSRCSSNDPSD